MHDEPTRHDRPVAKQLHPLVHRILIGLALWFAAAAWGFARDGYVDYLLAVVTGFVLIAIAIPYLMSRIWRKSPEGNALRGHRTSFGDWASGEFETWQDRVGATNAAVEILLPVAAAAVGMTAFGIVLHFTG
jgi:hypothetical protein